MLFTLFSWLTECHIHDVNICMLFHAIQVMEHQTFAFTFTVAGHLGFIRVNTLYRIPYVGAKNKPVAIRKMKRKTNFLQINHKRCTQVYLHIVSISCFPYHHGTQITKWTHQCGGVRPIGSHLWSIHQTLDQRFDQHFGVGL
jgi:hypothetical protein